MDHSANIVHCFEQLVDKQTISTDTNASFRIRTYRTIIKDVKETFSDTPITTVDVFTGRKGYGKSSLQRIQEIIDTGTLKELLDTSEDGYERHQCIKDLTRVIGIGAVKARKIYDSGGSVALLHNAYQQKDASVLNPFKLTTQQLLGFKYIEDLNKRIPRDIIAGFETTLNQYCVSHQRYTSQVCGSYRRGQVDSGDIDVLITSDTWDTEQHARDGLVHLLQHLCSSNYLVDHMTEPKRVKTKYMGFLNIPALGYVCRIDIRSVVHTHYPFALAYFTGSKEENMRLRHSAKRQGFKLSEYGLENQQDNTKHIFVSNEEELYASLNEAYVLPTNR